MRSRVELAVMPLAPATSASIATTTIVAMAPIRVGKPVPSLYRQTAGIECPVPRPWLLFVSRCRRPARSSSEVNPSRTPNESIECRLCGNIGASREVSSPRHTFPLRSLIDRQLFPKSNALRTQSFLLPPGPPPVVVSARLPTASARRGLLLLHQARDEMRLAFHAERDARLVAVDVGEQLELAGRHRPWR